MEIRRNDDDAIQATFTTQELQVLVNLTEQLLELLGEGELHTATPGEALDPFLSLMGISVSDTPPEDPVLRRLFPDAYQEPEAAAEFRRYTEHGLREKKRAHALLIHEALTSELEAGELGTFDSSTLLDPTSVDRTVARILIRDEDLGAWLAGSNDLRLALAVRLGIGDEFGKSQLADSKRYELMTESDPMKAVYAVYNWLGWLQQSLLEILMDSGDQPQAT